jgi:hypothetical protein
VGFSLHDLKFYLYFCFGMSRSKPLVAGPSPLLSISVLPDASMLLNSPTFGIAGSGRDQVSVGNR